MIGLILHSSSATTENAFFKGLTFGKCIFFRLMFWEKGVVLKDKQNMENNIVKQLKTIAKPKSNQKRLQN